jgi:GTPase SAR1 family protein
MKIEGADVTVCIWDTAGQEKFLSLTKNYFKKADGVLVVFDLTDKVSFDRTSIFT